LWQRTPGKLLSPSFRARLLEFFETHLSASPSNAATDVEGEDLVQEVYLRLLTTQHSVQKVASYVLREHESRSLIEHIAERYEESRHGYPGTDNDPTRLLLTTEDLEKAVAVVMKLPHKWQQVWASTYLEELTPAEIAEQVGTDERTTREFLDRVRSYLNKHARHEST